MTNPAPSQQPDKFSSVTNLTPITDAATGNLIGYGLTPEHAQTITQALLLAERTGYLLNIELAYTDYGPDQTSPSRLEYLIFRTTQERDEARIAAEALILAENAKDFNMYNDMHLVLLRPGEVFDTPSGVEDILGDMGLFGDADSAE